MNVSYAKIIATILTLLFSLSGAASAQTQQATDISDVLTYIDHSWDVLTRSPVDCKTVMDVRVPEHSLLYLPDALSGARLGEGAGGEVQDRG